MNFRPFIIGLALLLSAINPAVAKSGSCEAACRDAGSCEAAYRDVGSCEAAYRDVGSCEAAYRDAGSCEAACRDAGSCEAACEGGSFCPAETGTVAECGTTISDLIASGALPGEDFLIGEWHCTGGRFVFMDQAGPVPSKAESDMHLKGMGATADNCVLSFTKGCRCNFRLGARAFDLKWSINPATGEFQTAFGLFVIKGFLVQDADKIILVYSRPNLFLMMKFLCTDSGRKHIAPLGSLLDCTDGLTIGMEFSK